MDSEEEKEKEEIEDEDPFEQLRKRSLEQDSQDMLDSEILPPPPKKTPTKRTRIIAPLEIDSE